MTAAQIKQLRSYNAAMVRDLNIMQQRCSEFERLLHLLQGELETYTPKKVEEIDLKDFGTLEPETLMEDEE